MSTEISHLIQVMDELREKCPWDREQTHRSLLTYLIEETYELVEAIESNDAAAMREELGDLLLQIIFHAKIASESQAFDIEEVAGAITEKLIRRHPHVFGGASAATSEEVEKNWERLKAVEKQRDSVVDGIPLSQPSLAWTNAVISRATKANINVELSPIASPETLTPKSIGALLLAVVGLAQSAGIDPEQALREAGRELIEQVKNQQDHR